MARINCFVPIVVNEEVTWSHMAPSVEGLQWWAGAAVGEGEGMQ